MDLCSAYHFYAISRGAWIISVPWTKSANVCLHLLPPISDHVIVHLRGNSCATFYTSLSAREYLKIKLKYPLNWIITWPEMGSNKGKQTLADSVYS